VLLLFASCMSFFFFFFSSRRRHTRSKRDWSSDVCSSDLFFYPFINDWFNGIHYPCFSLLFRFHFKLFLISVLTYCSWINPHSSCYTCIRIPFLIYLMSDIINLCHC